MYTGSQRWVRQVESLNVWVDGWMDENGNKNDNAKESGNENDNANENEIERMRMREWEPEW